MVFDVFMKQIRRLSYNSIFEAKKWANRRIGNLIKDLRKDNLWQPIFENLSEEQRTLALPFKGTYHDVVGKNIQDLVEKTYDFETTLWFTEDDEAENKLKNLAKSLGKVTMCYNILRYSFELLKG